MIPGRVLSAWLHDRPAQSETAETLEQVARHLRGLPVMARLEEALAGAQSGGAEAVLALADRFITTSGAIQEILDALVGIAGKDPYFRPHYPLALSEAHTGLLLFDQPALTLTIGVISADALAAKRAEHEGGASLVFTGRRSMIQFVKSGGAIVSFWEAPPIEAGFTAGGSGRCRFVERRRIEDGEKLDIDGGRFAFIIEEAANDLVLVQATTLLGAAPLTAEYDSATFRFVGASSTDEAGSRIQMMLALLRIMDRQDAAPLFREMLESKHFYARWQAMREFLALNAAAALPHLRAMAAADPHPEVRQVAAQTLAHFFPEENQPEEEMMACPS